MVRKKGGRRGKERDRRKTETDTHHQRHEHLPTITHRQQRVHSNMHKCRQESRVGWHALHIHGDQPHNDNDKEVHPTNVSGLAIQA